MSLINKLSFDACPNTYNLIDFTECPHSIGVAKEQCIKCWNFALKNEPINKEE